VRLQSTLVSAAGLTFDTGTFFRLHSAAILCTIAGCNSSDRQEGVVMTLYSLLLSRLG
jgi:hypothetical protein